MFFVPMDPRAAVLRLQTSAPPLQLGRLGSDVASITRRRSWFFWSSIPNLSPSSIGDRGLRENICNFKVLAAESREIPPPIVRANEFEVPAEPAADEVATLCEQATHPHGRNRQLWVGLIRGI